MTKRAQLVRELGDVVRRFEARIPDASEDIVGTIWKEIPSYAAVEDQGVRAEVTQAVRRNVRAYLRALSEGRELPKRDIDELAVVGEARAHQGIPIEDVLKAFRTVGRVLWDHLSEDLTTSAAPLEVAVELSGTLMRFTDQISSGVAHHYSLAQRSIVRQQEAARREFFHDLLQGTYESPDEMVQRAREFGYDLARPYIGVVARRDGVRPDANTEQLELSRALDSLGERVQSVGRPMVDRRGGQNIGLLALSASSEITPGDVAEFVLAELGEKWRLGVGGPYAGLEGCRHAFTEASEALEIGSALNRERRSYVFEQYLLYRFLRADAALVERFVEAVLGNVLEHDRRRRSELVKTLEAYFGTDASAKEAGRQMYAHPHTITYRLKQVERLTGRSLRDPEDKLHLHLAVKALRLIESTWSREEHPPLYAAGH